MRHRAHLFCVILCICLLATAKAAPRLPQSTAPVQVAVVNDVSFHIEVYHENWWS